jgi:hypothetical protein
MAQRYRRPESDVPERPITFNAAEGLGAFELAELACMSALAGWLTRWLPIAIHSAMRAGAQPEAVARACGLDVGDVYQRWNEWAIIQRDFILDGKPGITDDQYEAVAARFEGRIISRPRADREK